MKYAVLALSSVIIMAGYVAAAVISGKISPNISNLLLAIPTPLLFILSVYIEQRNLRPKLLLNHKLIQYSASVFLLVFSTSFLGIEAECWLGNILGQSIHPYNALSIGSLCEALGNSIMFTLMILAFASHTLYVDWHMAVDQIQIDADRLQDYINEIKQRLKTKTIISMLELICHSLINNPNEAQWRLADLSDYLRKSLYALPPMPEVGLSTAAATEAEFTPFSNKFIGSDRFRLLRHIILALILAGISINCAVYYPTANDVDLNLTGSICMFAFLLTIAEVIILWLFPKLTKSGKMKKYIVAISVFSSLLFLPAAALQLWICISATNVPSVWRIVSGVSNTLGFGLSIALYLGGISGFLILQELVRTRLRKSLLKLETMRYEYIFLRRHINPHLLFNVLNNINFITLKNPASAYQLMVKLKSMMERLFAEQSSHCIPFSDEIAFLTDYLDLEASRKEGLSYNISTDNVSPGLKVPSLLFIPFVENAVKYSYTSTTNRNIVIEFGHQGGYLTFNCYNEYDPRKRAEMASGELGVSNTLRRMQLLFDDNFFYNAEDKQCSYQVQIKLPVL